MCKFTNLPPSAQSPVSPTDVVQFLGESQASCVIQFGYTFESNNICAECLRNKPPHEQSSYEFTLRHYVQICREREVPKCDTCDLTLAFLQPWLECEYCPEALSKFLVYLARQGENFENLDDSVRIFTD